MLEFYQAWATYEDLMALTEEMLGEIARRVTGGTRVVFEGTELDFSPPFRRLPMAEAVAAKAGIPVADATDVAALTALADRMGIAREGRQEGLGILADVFEHLCEADLVQPTFVTGFPAEVSPLARRSDADPRFVDRFEMYAAGREIANGFSELNDPEDQRERFLVQVRRREAGDAEAQMLDEDYVRALEYGLPPTAGEGIGIDRLTMLLTDSASIRDVILFPHLRPED
jgi:lysyl-tRNA synthetase class 2